MYESMHMQVHIVHAHPVLYTGHTINEDTKYRMNYTDTFKNETYVKESSP